MILGNVLFGIFDNKAEKMLCIVQLYKSGYSPQAIADAFQVHPNTVFNYYRRYRAADLAGLLAPPSSPAPPPPAVPVEPEPPPPPLPVPHSARYAGGLLALPFLQFLGLPSTLRNLLDQRGLSRPQNPYDLFHVLLTLFFAFFFQLASVEALKAENRAGWGLLLGLPAAPCVRTMRRQMQLLNACNLGPALSDALAKAYITLGIVQWGVLYLDGHFLPYYGIRNLRKGWFTTHRMAIPGNLQFLAHDLRGRPVFFLLDDAAAAFPSAIVTMAKKALELGGPGEHPLILVFDRGGFSAELFRLLDELGVIFVTWLRYSPPPPRELCSTQVTVRRHGEETPCWLGETTTAVKDYHPQVKTVAFTFNQETDPVALTTNWDRVDPQSYTPEQPVALLSNRWVQENGIKREKNEYHMDHAFGYITEALKPENEPQVANPAHKKLRVQVKKEEQSLNRAERDLLRYREQAEKRGKTFDKYSRFKGYAKLEERRWQQAQALERLQRKLAELPQQVPLSQALGADHADACRFDRKFTLDTLKIAAINCREYLVDKLSNHFPDQREVRKVLQALIESPGVIQELDGTLQVRFPSLGPPSYDAAAAKLLAELNAMGGRTLNGTNYSIRFELAHKDPAEFEAPCLDV